MTDQQEVALDTFNQDNVNQSPVQLRSSPGHYATSPQSDLMSNRSRSVNFSGESTNEDRRKRLQRTPTPYWPRKELSEGEEASSELSDWSRQNTLEDVEEVDVDTRPDGELQRNSLFRRGLERQKQVTSRDNSPVSKVPTNCCADGLGGGTGRRSSLHDAVLALPEKLRKTIARNASLGSGDPGISE
ncbi:hypothetical protein CAPTEDRAFT_196760 [Capitella teleta]|uniref:Uncharacterized protein n=1 Tax=Capitella teleta TaxID=283909 RepID=R7V298_CAPTE|nr:hypothetical protein CAPTEDRAFT_196760 [Capitella teleta]|eukprot:ELU12978.1 hypothetical protein CAPTEDRAFT_196760 [Capitella teleta]